MLYNPANFIKRIILNNMNDVIDSNSETNENNLWKLYTNDFSIHRFIVTEVGVVEQNADTLPSRAILINNTAGRDPDPIIKVDYPSIGIYTFVHEYMTDSWNIAYNKLSDIKKLLHGIENYSFNGTQVTRSPLMYNDNEDRLVACLASGEISRIEPVSEISSFLMFFNLTIQEIGDNNEFR